VPYELRLHMVAKADQLLAVPGSGGRRFNRFPVLFEFRPFPFPWRGECAVESESGMSGPRRDPVLKSDCDASVPDREDMRARLPLLARVDDYGPTLFGDDELDQLAAELMEADAIVGPGVSTALGIAGRAISQLRPHLLAAVFHGR